MTIYDAIATSSLAKSNPGRMVVSRPCRIVGYDLASDLSYSQHALAGPFVSTLYRLLFMSDIEIRVQGLQNVVSIEPRCGADVDELYLLLTELVDPFFGNQ